MSLSNTFTLNVDFKKSTYLNEPIVTSNDEITFILNVFDDEQPFDLSNVTTVTLTSVRPDKQSVLTNGTKTGNQVTFNLGNTEVAVAGRVNAQVQMYDASGRVSTLPFTYKVLKDPVQDYVPSVDEQTLIELVLGEGPVILANAEQAITDLNNLNTTVTANEEARQSSELNRETSETMRALNESDRQSAETTRQENESARESAELSRTTDETIRQLNETDRQNAETNRTNTFNTQMGLLNDALPNVQNLENVQSWSGATQYYKNNIVEYNGSSFMAIADSLGQTPPTLPTLSNEHWVLMSRKGDDGTGNVNRVRDVFTATEGQTDFTLSQPYDQFQNRIEVFVGNIPQFSPDNFIELSSTKIRFTEGLPAGVEVIATYYTRSIPLASDIQTTVDNHTTTLNNHEVRVAETETNVTSLTTQLAETAKEIKVKTDTQPKPKTNAIATVIWDDGYMEDYNVVYPYMQSKGIVGASALVKDWVGTNGFMTWNEINEMKQNGWEFLSHTVRHRELPSLNREGIEYELRESKKFLVDNGLDISGIVYPRNFYNNDVLEIVRKYYDYAFSKDEEFKKTWINYEPINQYAIYRIDLESSLENFIGWVGDALEKKAWIVLMGHGHYYNAVQFPDTTRWPGKWDDNIAKMKANIQWLIDQGVEIVPPKEAIERIGNAITIGDDKISESHFMISKTGKIKSPQLPKDTNNIVVLEGQVDNSTPMSFFETNKLTISTHKVNQNAGFPTTGGRLYTYNFGDAKDFIHQIWYPYNNKDFYLRNWESWNNAWGAWTQYTNTPPPKTEGVVSTGTYTGMTVKLSTLNIPTQVDANYAVLATPTWDAGSIYAYDFTTTEFKLKWTNAPTQTSKLAFRLVR